MSATKSRVEAFDPRQPCFSQVSVPSRDSHDLNVETIVCDHVRRFAAATINGQGMLPLESFHHRHPIIGDVAKDDIDMMTSLPRFVHEKCIDCFRLLLGDLTRAGLGKHTVRDDIFRRPRKT